MRREYEDELVQKSRSGDLASFNALVEAYQEQVYNLALRMLGNKEAAEDATQDAFLSAYKAISSFRGGNFRVWILRIVSNTCYTYLRALKRRPIISLDALVLEPESIAAGHQESPEDFTIRRELGQAVSRGLASLPADQRLVVILSDIQGLSYEEIAQATGSSLGTVKSRLSRARAHLRDYLLQQGELLPREYRH